MKENDSPVVPISRIYRLYFLTHSELLQCADISHTVGVSGYLLFVTNAL